MTERQAKVFHGKKKSAKYFSCDICVPASVTALEAFPIMEKALVFLFVFVQVSCEIVNQRKDINRKKRFLSGIARMRGGTVG